MAINQNFPSVAPSLGIDFARSKRIDSRITFSRAQSSGNNVTYTGSDGLVKFAIADQPRLEHSTDTVTNLALYSEDFSNAVWKLGGSGAGATVTSNTAIAPDGSLTADTLDDSGTNAVWGRLQDITINPDGNIVYTASVYIKNNTSACCSMRVVLSGGGTSTVAELVIDPVNIAVQWRSGSSGTSFSTPVNLGNGWYRYSLNITNTNSHNNLSIEIRPAFASTYNVTFDNAAVGSIFVWGAQVEISSTYAARKYVQTTATSVTETIRTSLGLLVEESKTNFLKFSETPAVQFTGTATTETATITNVADTTGLVAGMVVQSPNSSVTIPASTTISSISGTTVTLSSNITVTSGPLNSVLFAASRWTMNNMVPTGNPVVLPTGEISNAVEFRGQTTDANIKMFRPSPTGGNGVAANEWWCFSVFVKAGTENKCHLALLDRFNSGSCGRTFNMKLGQWAESSLGFGGNVTTGASGFIPYPNGWYRVWIACKFTVAEPEGHQTYIRLNANSQSIAVTTSFSAWGCQLEKGFAPSSYIRNTTDTSGGVTRSADNASMTGSNFTSFYNPINWTMTVAARRNYGGNFLGYPNLLRINDGTSNNSVAYYGALDSEQFTNFGVYSGGVNQTDYAARSISSTSLFKMIHALKLNNSTFGVDGVLTTTDTSVLMPIGANQMIIGGDNKWGGTLSYIRYYPSHISNTQLQALTR